MRVNYIDLEKSIYLEALNKNNIYREYLYSLSDEVDNSLERYEVGSIKKIINLIKGLSYQIKKDKKPRILPILTSLDSEKAYLYDSIKAEFQNQVILYIPLCPIDERILYHIYSCFIEDLGLETLELLNPNSIDLRRNNAIGALREYQQDSNKKELLSRWFLNNLTEEEGLTLGIPTNIRDDENSLEMIKCMCNSFEDAVLLFFEDIELIHQKYGEQYGEIWGIKAETVFLNTFYSFFTEIRNVLIILPCIKTSWNGLLKSSSINLRSVLESYQIEFFDLKGLKRKIMKIMDFYWLQNRIRPPSNPFFPLDEDLLETFLEESQGNLKKFFILWIKSVEEILLGKKSPAEID